MQPALLSENYKASSTPTFPRSLTKAQLKGHVLLDLYHNLPVRRHTSKKARRKRSPRGILLLIKIAPGRLLPSKRVRWCSRCALLLSHSKLWPSLGRRNVGEDLGRRDTDTEGAEVDETDCANYCRRGLQPLRWDPWQCRDKLYRSPGPGSPGSTFWTHGGPTGSRWFSYQKRAR